MAIEKRSWRRRYGCAVAGALIASLVRVWLTPLIGGESPYLAFLIAVAITAWYGGFRPGILCLALCVVVAIGFVVSPRELIPTVAAERWIGLALFCAAGLAIVMLGGVTGSARRELENALESDRLQREQFRVAFQSLGEGMITTDAEEIITSMNPVGERMTGWPIAEALGKPLWTVFRAVDALSRSDGMSLEQVKQLGSTVHSDDHTLLVSRDGRNRPIEHCSAPIKNERDEIVGIVLNFRDITERKKAQEALSQSEKRFRLAAEAVNGIIYDADPTTGIVERTRGLLEVLGYRPEDVPPTFDWWRERMHPDDRVALDRQVRLIEEGGDRYASEYRIRHRDGRYLNVIDRGILTRDKAGLIVRYVGCTQDITEIKRAEDALRESEERFRQLAEALPLIVWIARPDHSIEYMNGRWAQFTGGGNDEASLPGGWMSAIHPDDLPELVRASERSRVSRQPFESEFRLRDREGCYRWQLARGVLVHDDAGVLIRTIGTTTDIDEQKRAAEAARFLADAGAKLAALVDEVATLQEIARLAVPAIADCCVVDLLDEEGILHRKAVAHVDEAAIERVRDAEAKFPTSRDRPGGLYDVIRTGEARMAPHINDGMLAAWAQSEEHLEFLRSLKLTSYLCVPLKGRIGTLGVIAVSSTDSRRPYGERELRLAEDLAHRAAIAIENSRLYAQLIEADRRKDEFLATLAHELRNPLAPIRNSLHLLDRHDGDGQTSDGVRTVLRRQVELMTRLVDDLMDVSRITRGKIDLRKEVVELAAIVAAAVEANRPLLEDRGHKLSISLPSEPIRLEADATRLGQIFDNLLANAAKFTNPGGQIELTAGREGETAVIRVRDNGIGISAEKLPVIFDLFVQGVRRLADSYGGLGIGLSLVRSLVELHGGTVTVQSEGLGRGSEFIVRFPALPAAASHPEPRGSSSGRRMTAPIPRRRILVVDDNVDSARTMALLLKRSWGQEVEVAYDGEAAVEAAITFKPEVVLIDIGLPGMSGYDVARCLRERPEFAHTFLLAMTGWGQEEDRRRSREAGIDHHLIKPIDPVDLHRLLAGYGQPA